MMIRCPRTDRAKEPDEDASPFTEPQLEDSVMRWTGSEHGDEREPLLKASPFLLILLTSLTSYALFILGEPRLAPTPSTIMFLKIALYLGLGLYVLKGFLRHPLASRLALALSITLFALMSLVGVLVENARSSVMNSKIFVPPFFAIYTTSTGSVFVIVVPLIIAFVLSIYAVLNVLKIFAGRFEERSEIEERSLPQQQQYDSG